MIPASLNLFDLLGSITGFVFTLMVFSYLIGDNDLFRFAIHLAIGVTAGFAAVAIWYNVIWPQMVLPFWGVEPGERGLLVFPLLMSLLLLAKASPRLSAWGTPAVAFLVGVGAASAVGGAITGTLFPQVLGSINQLDWRAANPKESDVLLSFVHGLIFLVGTVSTLVYFQFGVRGRGKSARHRAPYIQWLADIGQMFLAIGLGVIFSGVLLAALAALVERWTFIIQFLKSLIAP